MCVQIMCVILEKHTVECTFYSFLIGSVSIGESSNIAVGYRSHCDTLNLIWLTRINCDENWVQNN